jgi:hypothetical protein
MPPTVLLSAPPARSADDLRELLAAGGFAVARHALGSAPAVDFSALAAAVVDAGDQPDMAAAQARRWRSELSDEVFPVVWVLDAADPARAAAALAAGADAVLPRPLHAGWFVAQLRAAVRAREAAARVAVRAAEAQLLGDQLNRAVAQLDRELDDARRLRLARRTGPLPAAGQVRLAAHHLPRGGAGGDFHAAESVGPDRLVFLVGSAAGSGVAAGLIGPFLSDSIVTAARGNPHAAAGELVTAANRDLLRLGLADPPLVALFVGLMNPHSGELGFARAGTPAPVYVPADSGPELWSVPGPFLGVAETTYATHTARLCLGDRLLVGTDGTRPDADADPAATVRLLADQFRDRAGQRFVDAVAVELLSRIDRAADFTLLGLDFGFGQS